MPTQSGPLMRNGNFYQKKDRNPNGRRKPKRKKTKRSKHSDKRHTAKCDEDKSVSAICAAINDPNSSYGNLLRVSYKLEYKRVILRAEKTGNNGTHFDILITEKADENHPETKRKIEHKGIIKFIESIPDTDTPWKWGVERYNGKCHEFAATSTYGEFWYKNVVCNTEISDIYCPGIVIPPIDEWMTKDANRCGDPQTEYGKTLKKEYRRLHGEGSMNGKKGSPRDYREIVNPLFVEMFNNDEELKLKTINQTQNILNKIMTEKERWLLTSGSLNDKFNFKWIQHIPAETITDVYASWNPGADVYLKFKAYNHNKKHVDFDCIIRFGKGTGFSNIRYDIR